MDSIGLVISWSAYLKMLSLEPSHHCRRRPLILCAGTLYPHMNWCVDSTKVMTVLLLTYPHVLEKGCSQFFARRLAILFRVVVASTPSIPSTEATKGEKCQRCWRKASSYIFFLLLSASSRHLSGDLSQ